MHIFFSCSDGFFFAVKEASLLDEGSNQGKQSLFQLRQEISLLSRFQHENIVRYFGTQEDQSSLYIFLELVPKGSLLSLYQKYSLNDSHVSAYTRQILHGLKYLHNQNVIHRDIKCANILVDVSGSVKLADFGLAKATENVKSSKGSPYWMAPEVVNLKNDDGYGLAADIWSLGCTVLEMLIGKRPYSDLEGVQALFRIGRGEPPPIPETLSKDARDFILECLQLIPAVIRMSGLDWLIALEMAVGVGPHSPQLLKGNGNSHHSAYKYIQTPCADGIGSLLHLCWQLVLWNLPSELASAVPQTITVTPKGNVAIQRVSVDHSLRDLTSGK
ncbi:hypothetical protein AHAS_Ahas03G0362200 [Arachis hypogaea]